MKFEYGNIKLSDDINRNYIVVENEEFLLSYLNPNFQSNKGASSNLFILQDPSGETEDRVIKICKTPYVKYRRDKKIERFNREIRAFKLVKKNNLNGVIRYFGSGITMIDGYSFLYIILEKANDDLASFMEENQFDFSINQKLNFCINILNNIKQLHRLGIYHRDIKHDNVLIVNEEFKIGDLGLVAFRDQDSSIDNDNEKIGPAGWLSPEATNKMLTYNKKVGNVYDCVINNKSDIFQIGKLFWYIFQGNLPTGQVLNIDKRFADEDIFNLIFSMIQYEKNRRPDIDQLNYSFEPIKRRLFV